MQKTNDLQVLLGEILSGQNLLAGVLSKPRKKGDPPYGKVSLRPVELRGILHYQATYHYPDREIHDNLTVQDAKQLILQDLEDTFRQANFYTVQADWQVLVSKKGVVKILQHPPSRQKSDVTLEHNRSKRYLLKEGVAYPFLVELGVMNSSGKVLAKRYHKFRQLNKYLEIVEDCLPYLTAKTNGHPLTIVDFGSGKAYLTFALYHFLVEHLGLNVELIGLDLKKDVVSFCNQMAEKLGYDNLKFLHQDIRDFEATGKVDMVVSYLAP
ncbi:MAG: methyltransferase [Firmicutes bacterium]|mgnify:CR=1 FL=1|nr:methyltransferase [Bacillota bacterium]